MHEIFQVIDFATGELTMTNITSLRNHLLVTFPDLKNDWKLETNELDGFSHSFSNFLDTVRVAAKHLPQKSQERKTQLQPRQELMSHAEFIDSIYQSISENHSSLLDISSFPEAGQEDNKMRFQMNRLKEKEWVRICDRIGRSRFYQLIQSAIGFYEGSGVFLRVHYEGHATRDKKKSHHIDKSKMYYHWKSRNSHFSAFDGTPHQITKTILADGGVTSGKIPNTAKKLLKIIGRAQKVDSRLDYFGIFDNVVGSARGPQVFESASCFDNVLKFVFICLHRVFSDIVFGTPENKKIVQSSVRAFLRLQRKELYDLSKVSNQLKVSSISWIGKSKQISSTHDLFLRQQMLQSFLRWLFDDFIVNLIKNFWYVSEVQLKNLSETGSAYFPHRSWRILSDEWVINYVHSYLKEVDPRSDRNTRYFNHGCLRILPKSNDFRPLCVPCKYHLSEELNASFRDAFKIYDWNTIRPLRDILRMQQTKVDSEICPRIYSTRGVLIRLAEYKETLLKSRKTLPAIFALKFDMKHCYDNLNQSKIIEIINDLFSSEKDEEEYYVRRISSRKNLRALHSKFRPLMSTRLRVCNLDVIHNPDCIDGGSFTDGDDKRIFRFTKGEILDVVKHQVLNSTIELPMFPKRTFMRKRGIFQGTALLATFCDIVYNRLASELFLRIKEREESTLLRLADDFLFLSTSQKHCEDMLNMATSPIATDYGAYINADKCSTINAIVNSTFNFVGLEIDIKTLNARCGALQPLNIPRKSQKSFQSVLQYLRWNCGVRLNNCNLNLRYTSETAIIDHINDILEPALDSVAKYFPLVINEKQEQLQCLIKFCFEIVLIFMEKLISINGNDFNFESLYLSVANVMRTKLWNRFAGIGDLVSIYFDMD